MAQEQDGRPRENNKDFETTRFCFVTKLLVIKARVHVGRQTRDKEHSNIFKFFFKQVFHG